ncbi:MAG: hypothetical protein BWY57_00818 [Betaproteobacteria bacterium ADurb.Bin341]|nr:MAG: hypothetical protein BWY57_00818 [Betaproteobacteria bacterium ADurb.Bin341]
MRTIIIDLDKLARNALEGIVFAAALIAAYAIVELIETPDWQVKAGVTAHPARASVASPNPVTSAAVSFPVGAGADQKQAAPLPSGGVRLLRDNRSQQQ